MRHLKHKFQLGRKKEHREALMANMASALIRHDRIRTTLAKAKALRPFVEKVITLAKDAQTASPAGSLHLRRQAISKIRDRDAVAILFNEKASMFLNRPGGYTRIYKLGTRIGDAAEIAVIQLISAEDEGHTRRGGKVGKALAATKAAAGSEASEIISQDNAVSDQENAEDGNLPADSETDPLK